jgi:membrane fusion protein (multidrug efflux system)
VFVIVSGCLVNACTSSKAAPTPPAPPRVAVEQIAPRRVTLSSEWVASLDGFVNAQIRPQVSGYLVRRTYDEGTMVRQGQVLFEIDPRPFEAALSQAKAHLAEAEAQLGKAQRDLARDKPLAEQRAIAQSQLDTDVQAELAANAGVKSAQAAVETAELNRSFTRVTSLIGGLAAIATAQIGDLVGPTTLLTTVSQIDPIRAYFSLGEREYLRIANQINAPGPDKHLWGNSNLHLILADGSEYPRAGKFFAADKDIDPKTGTIRISVTFPNPSGTLRPGQYGRVRAETRTIDDALLVPQGAVNEVQGAYQVRVVGPDNRVATRVVMVGDRVGNEWLIEKGVKAGDRIVLEGAAVTDGTVISPTDPNPRAAH